MNRFVNKLSPSVTHMIRMDHSQVLATFHRFEPGGRPQTRRAVVNTACLAIEIHSRLEEEIFYPALRAVLADPAMLDRSVPEHQEMHRLIATLRAMDPSAPSYDSTFMELMRDVIHHVADEETLLLPQAERLLVDRLGELGIEMTKRRVQLAAPHAGEIALDTARAFPTMSMVLAAGTLIAGTYLVRRNWSSHA